jgi:hypothetical protein
MASPSEPRAPRHSAEVVQRSLRDLRAQRRTGSIRRTIFGLAVVAALVWGGNLIMFGRPVSRAIASDPHTAGMGVAAHLRHYVDPTTLVLDLRRAAVADTSNLLWAVLLAGKALNAGSRRFRRVVLSRAGSPVFVLDGHDFQGLANEFSAGRNPVALLRSIPARLRLPDGQPAPSADVGGVARRWAAGAP